MCFPNLDSPTVFAAMLDDKHGGRFRIAPADGEWRTNQLYIPETNVLVTQFLSDDGIGEITDFMPIGDHGHPHRIVRRVTTLKGAMTFRLRCAPRFDYARRSHTAVLTDDGAARFTPEGDDLKPARLRSLDPSVTIEIDADDATATFSLQPNGVADFVFEAAETDRYGPATEQAYIDDSLVETLAYWRDWVRLGTYPKRWRDVVVRSALTMKMLCSSKSGGIAAAATFGLPEEIGGERNWDYRFTWIRDGSLTAASLTSLGFTQEMEAYIGWLDGAVHRLRSGRFAADHVRDRWPQGPHRANA